MHEKFDQMNATILARLDAIQRSSRG
jgi:hypothetical protein